MARETAETRTERQAREIQDIIDTSNDEISSRHLEGQDLLEARAKCSRAIAEAARRHVAENNTADAGDAESSDDDAGQGEHAADTGDADGRPGADMVR